MTKKNKRKSLTQILNGHPDSESISLHEGGNHPGKGWGFPGRGFEGGFCHPDGQKSNNGRPIKTFWFQIPIE